MPTDFPVDHLSASSLTTFMRCPRQFQDKYIHGNVGKSSGALVLGSFVHMMLAHLLKGEVLDAKNAWDLTLLEHGAKAEDFHALPKAIPGGQIEWGRDTPETIYNRGLKMVYDYYEKIGKHMEVEDTEVEIEIEVPGVDIPVVGFIDYTSFGLVPRIVDIKTTGYFSSKQVRLNPEWKWQANIYQLHAQVPAEFHVITRAKEDSIRVPSSVNDPLYVHPPDPTRTFLQIEQVYKQMKHAWETWGHSTPWVGGVTHDWAGRYCGVENCCQR